MIDTGPARDSFGEFVARALPGLLRFGHVLTGDAGEAEDLVQEALARSLRRWHSVRRGDAMAYVRRVMVNTHITRWRQWHARVRLGEPPDTAADHVELHRSEEWDQLRRALVKLSARQRTVLVLRYYEDLPDAQIADLMGCRPATVRSTAARGLAALRPLLQPEAGRPENDRPEAGRPENDRPENDRPENDRPENGRPGASCPEAARPGTGHLGAGP